MKSIDLAKVFCLLESSLVTHEASKTNFAALGAKRLLASYGKSTFLYSSSGVAKLDLDPWEALKQFKEESKSTIYGYLGYDLKNTTEELYSENEDPIGAPDQFWFEPLQEYKWSVATEMPHVVEQFLELNCDEKLPKQTFKLLNPGVSKNEYLAKVQQVKDAIKEGSFYELNLTRLQTFQNPGLNAWQLYKKMKAVGNVPFGAFLNLGNGLKVCCSSPERFLKKDGKHLISQPIKGTRSRSKNAFEDKVNYQDLANSEKDKAENLMIVDLVRNDLNRVSKKGSEKVSSLFKIQAFDTVYQMVSTVEAELDKKYHAIDVLKATFPMGSMTGAPKVEVMKWVEKIENYKRGIYSGAIGYIDLDENFDFNVVIRTAILKNGFIYYATGGAITSDSDPESEWQETVVKTAALEAIFKNKEGNNF